MNIIVFVRSHNDFDHVLPILDYLIRSKSLDVTIYGLYSYEKCERHMSYVKTVLNQEVISFDQVHHNTVDRFFLNLIKVLVKVKRPKGKLLGFLFVLFEKNLQRLFSYIVSSSEKKFIKGLPSDTVIMADYGTEKHFPYNYLIHYSRIFKVPIIAYMHGYYCWENLDIIQSSKPNLPQWSRNLINNFLCGQGNREYYDSYLIGPHQKNTYFKSTLYNNFKEPSRLIEIGLPRFSYEWISKFGENSILCEKKQIDNDIKVALFLSNQKFNVDTGALEELINRLVSIKEISLKIVPHTRSGLSSLDIDNNKVLSKVTSQSSSEVIQWADIGIVYGSSIIFEMLVKGVTVVIPKFISFNTTIFESNNVCISPNSLSELEKFICDYSPENKINKDVIDNFLSDYVYGNSKTYEELMGKFYYHIVSSLKKK